MVTIGRAGDIVGVGTRGSSGILSNILCLDPGDYTDGFTCEN